MKKYRAFILKDYLVSLVVMMLIYPIIIMILNVVSNYRLYDFRLQNEISLIHLSKRMIVAKDIEVNSDSLTYVYDNKEWTLRFADQRLYLTPGYQLILDDIDNGYFMVEDRIIYVIYTKNDKEYKKAISIL